MMLSLIGFPFYRDNYVYIHNSRRVYALIQMDRSQPQTQGDLVSNRVGHVGVIVNESWFIGDGGNNKSGMRLFYFLNLKSISNKGVQNKTYGKQIKYSSK